MERLEKKKISGRNYYYYSKWEWVNGKCRQFGKSIWGHLKILPRQLTEDQLHIVQKFFNGDCQSLCGRKVVLWMS
jgi:hypothetical protein